MRKRRAKGEAKTSRAKGIVPAVSVDYGRLVTGISTLLEEARRTAARAVNSVLTATYWEIGRRIVEHEQGGKERAEYGEVLMERLAQDLLARHGRGFSKQGLYKMRAFYQGWEIVQTPSGKLEVRVIFPTASGESESKIRQTVSGESVRPLVSLQVPSWPAIPLAEIYPLSWSQYVRLMSVEKPQARAFYESEAIRGGWSVRQLDRQISTQFYERAVRSKNPRALLARGQAPQAQDAVPVEEEVRDPYLLEFLNPALSRWA